MVLKKLFYFLVLHYHNSICQASPLIGRNVRLASPREFPFIVSLSSYKYDTVEDQERYHICGGSLITEKHVLTAAHCIQQNETHTDIRVKVASIDLRNNFQIFTVKKWTTYNQWSRLRDNEVISDNDVGIAKLTESVEINPAVVTYAPDNTYYGQTVVTAGWGVTISSNQPSRYLLTVELNVLQPQNCVHIYDGTQRNYLCTQGDFPVQVACGDSGGPLLNDKNEIIAIDVGWCSGKRIDDRMVYQNIHIPIYQYKQFIETKTARKKSCCSSLLCNSNRNSTSV